MKKKNNILKLGLRFRQNLFFYDNRTGQTSSNFRGKFEFFC